MESDIGSDTVRFRNNLEGFADAMQSLLPALQRMSHNVEHQTDERFLDPTEVILGQWNQNNVPRGERAGGV